MQQHKPQTTRLEQSTGERRRAAWEPPTLRAVGTIAELVQQTKKSGTQDCSGKKRFGSGITC
ncbi:MAG: hypothetical protein ACHQO8_07605 [Vicinamibacterales bacterium]